MITMTNNKNLTFLALAAALAPGFAAAQSLPDGVTLEGRVEYEYLSDGDYDTSGLYGDFDLSIEPGAFSGGFGFDLGVVGLDFEDVSEVAVFGAVTYGLGSSGKLSFGVPRSALSSHRHMPALGGVQLFDLELRTLTEGFVETAYLFGDDTPLGLRYDGDYGDLGVSASYHRLSDLDLDAFDVAATYSRNSFFLSGGFEHLTDGDSDLTLVRVEGGAETDLYSAGLGYSTFTGDGPSEDVLSAWASYYVMPQLEVTATVVDFDMATTWGLSAEYTFWKGAYGQLGYLDSDESDSIWDVSMGWKF